MRVLTSVNPLVTLLYVCAHARCPLLVSARAGAPLGGGGVPGTPRKEAVRRPSPNTRLYCKFPECRTLAPTNFSLESH